MEARSLDLKQFVLSELAKLELGIKVIDITVESTSIVFGVEIEDSIIEFLVNEANQFQVRSVLHENQKHTAPEILTEFNEFVASIIPIIKPVVMEKIDLYTQTQQKTEPQVQEPLQPPVQEVPQQTQSITQEIPQQVQPSVFEQLIQQPFQQSTPHAGSEITIEERERQVTQKEEQLKKRALTIQARARLLEFQMQAVDVESHFFEELKEEQIETKDIKAWLKRGRFIFEWIIMLAISLLIVAFLIANTR